MARLFFVMSLGLLIMGSFYGLSRRESATNPYSVAVTSVTREILQSQLHVVGQLTSARKQTIEGKGSMLISEVYVREGELVKKGQPIAAIARHDEMENLLSDYKDAKIEAAVSNESSNTAKELRARGAIPENQFQEAEIRRKKAETAVAKAYHAVEMMRQILSLAEPNDKPPFLIVAPQHGTIIRLNLEEGKFLLPTDGPSVIIADMNHLEVVSDVSPFDVDKIEIGQPVEFYLLEDETPLKGRVKSIAQEVLQSKGDSFSPINSSPSVIRVTADVYPPKGSKPLKLGLIGESRIITDIRQDVLVIPVDAILSDETHSYIYILEKGRAKKRDIKIGIIAQQKAEIVEGVSLNEQVIIRGQFLLHDQADVVIESSSNRRFYPQDEL